MTVKDFANQFNMTDRRMWAFIYWCNDDEEDWIYACNNEDILPPDVVARMVLLWEPFDDWEDRGWIAACKDYDTLKTYINSSANEEV